MEKCFNPIKRLLDSHLADVMSDTTLVFGNTLIVLGGRT